MLFSIALCFINMNTCKSLCSSSFMVTIKTNSSVKRKCFNFVYDLFSALSVYFA